MSSEPTVYGTGKDLSIEDTIHAASGAVPVLRLGEVKKGDVVATFAMVYGRVGRLEGDLVADQGYFTAQNVIATAGSPVFLMVLRGQPIYPRNAPQRAQMMWCGAAASPHPYLKGGDGFCVEAGAKSRNLGEIAMNGGDWILASTPQLKIDGQIVQLPGTSGAASPWYPPSRFDQHGPRVKSTVKVQEGATDLPKLEQQLVFSGWDADQPVASFTILGSDGTRRSFLTETYVRLGSDSLGVIRFNGVWIYFQRTPGGIIITRP